VGKHRVVPEGRVGDRAPERRDRHAGRQWSPGVRDDVPGPYRAWNWPTASRNGARISRRRAGWRRTTLAVCQRRDVGGVRVRSPERQRTLEEHGTAVPQSRRAGPSAARWWWATTRASSTSCRARTARSWRV
jgi:hypothetical protein